MNSRKPYIVEFTGTPEAGKTTVINILHEALLQMGYKVKVFPESAENTPKIFPKNSLEAKLWMHFDTGKHVVEAPFLTDYDIVIFDRGSLDIKFWLYLDSIYTTGCLVGAFLCSKTYIDQFPIFIFANLAGIAMYTILCISEINNLPLLLLNIIYTIVNIIGYYNWK